MSDNIDKDVILRYASFLYPAEKKLTIAQKRKILEEFVSRVVIQPDGKFDVVFKFPLLSELPAQAGFRPAFKPLLKTPQPIDFATTSRVMAGG